MKRQKEHILERFSRLAIGATGSSAGFAFAVLIILMWLACGPFTNFSDVWQLTINTLTTIITFLMVFLIQRAQNKDALAIHVKLDELIKVQKSADKQFVDTEDMSEDELVALKNSLAKFGKSKSKVVSKKEFPNRKLRRT